MVSSNNSSALITSVDRRGGGRGGHGGRDGGRGGRDGGRGPPRKYNYCGMNGHTEE